MRTLFSGKDLFRAASTKQAETTFSAAATQGSVRAAASPAARVKVAIVWYQVGDLRVHDHPGLVHAVATAESVAPVFVFDPRTYDQTRGPSAALVAAVEDLQRSLRARGSDLIIRNGAPEEVVPELAAALGASTVYAHDQVTHRERDVEFKVRDRISAQQATFVTWTAPLRRPPEGALLSENYTTYQCQARAFTIKPPLPAPAEVPPVPTASSSAARGSEIPVSDGKVDSEPFTHSGESTVLGSLDSFLKDGESLGKTVFSRYFPQQVALGCLSVREVYRRLRQYERDRGYTFGTSLKTTESALMAIEWAEFHTHIARQHVASDPSAQYWYWNGFLTHYTQAGWQGPAVLLVHGFGASSRHWRRNTEDLARDHRVWAIDMLGFGRSEKPDLPRLLSDIVSGQDPSYGTSLWSSHVRDFVREVVKEPVLVAGNSIGGFLSMYFAAQNPELARAVALLNTAGPIIAPGEPLPSVAKLSEKRREDPPLFAKWPQLANFLAWGLFQYLLRNIQSTLVRVYPDNPDALSDGVLAADIFRDACDPGAAGVLAAGFTLEPPPSLNELAERYAGPIIILQGRNDPLNDAEARAERLAAVYPPATLHLIEAGHCPHDERPDLVNPLLRDYSLRHLAPPTRSSPLAPRAPPATAASL